MQRLKLLEVAMTTERQFGGAEIMIDRRIKQGKILAALAMHDAGERNALYAAFVAAPWYTPPAALPLTRFKDYFGEKQGLACALVAHLAHAFVYLLVLGVVVQIDQLARDDVAVWTVAVYALVVVLWGVLVTEYWKRHERELALEWGSVGFEATELVRPQFKGVKMPSPVTGKPALFFPRGRREWRVVVGAVVTCACIAVDLCFVAGCIAIKTMGRTAEDGLDAKNAAGGTVLQGLGIPVFQAIFVTVAVALTDAENWPTDTIYQDKLIKKLTVFNFINSYTALFYTIFVPRTSAPPARRTSISSDARARSREEKKHAGTGS